MRLYKIIFGQDKYPNKVKIEKGVKQEYTISCIHFNFWKMSWEGRRININREHLNQPQFAVGILSIYELLAELHKMLNDSNWEIYIIDLKMNRHKTSTELLFNYLGLLKG